MTERKRLLLRLDPEIYDAIARWATDDLRSVNAQIEYALRRALQAAGRTRSRSALAEPSAPDQTDEEGDDLEAAELEEEA